ncbi:MAG: CBS domain-containing protein [Candidatus Aenigmatarchaeota archaeon]
MKVRDAMNPKVVVATKDISIKEVARIMAKYKIGSLIIVDKEKMKGLINYEIAVERENIIGVITESDIVRKVVALGLDLTQTKVEEVMTTNVIIVNADMDITEACQIMVRNKIKRLPVIDGGNLAGIITTTDIISVEPKLIEDLAKVMLFSERQLFAG